MANMAYTYDIPIAIQQQLVAVLRSNGQFQLAEMISAAKLDFDDVGLAYYAGLKGNNWDKHALDCNIYVAEKNMADIQRMKGVLKNWIQKLLPHDTGLLVRDISVIPRIEDENITLPETHGETWQVLHTDIMQALSRNEPTLVLDRLHTFSVKFIRELCDKKGIQTKDTNGKAYALHSLGGMLLKYYHANNVFQSVFSEQAMKTSISLFDRYNSVRNDQSYAHDNDVLNKAEATLAVRIMTATISFIDEMEG